MVTDPTAEGEREFRPRSPGPLWVWVKRASFVELAIFGGLLIVWIAPGLEGPTFAFGMAHGLGYVALCILLPLSFISDVFGFDGLKVALVAALAWRAAATPAPSSSN